MEMATMIISLISLGFNVALLLYIRKMDRE